MGRLDRSMQMIVIMKEFGWTYREFMETPSFVITLIIEKMVRDQKERELNAKRQHGG